MSFSVKDIINEAFDRTGIFPNPSDALPGEMFDQGFKALKGLVYTYNIRNYITCTQRMVELQVPSDGVVHLAKSEEGATPVIEDVTNVNTVYWVNSDENNTKLEYTAFMNFPKYQSGAYVYTWNQVGEYAYDVLFQKWMRGNSVKICYNVPFPCEKTTVFYLPPEYSELFILGLCLKLLAIYPREDKVMYEQMGEELKALSASIEAKQADGKCLEWNRYNYETVQAAFNSGSFLIGR